MKGWARLDEVPRLSRQRILDANDMLDAIEEAEEDAHRESETERRKGSRQP